MTRQKQRRVRVNVEVAPGEPTDLHALGILFKEVLQQIPGDQTQKLRSAYRQGKTIVVAMAPSRFGMDKKTAFVCSVTSLPLQLIFAPIAVEIELPEAQGTA